MLTESLNVIPQQSETILHLFNLNWSLNTLVQATAALIALTALVFLAYQSYLIRRAQDITALHMRHAMILENNKFIFENPDYLLRVISPSRYQQIKSMNSAERKSFAAWELLLDNLEFYFLLGMHDDNKHAHKLIRSLLKNPEVRAFMKSPLRGTFRNDFLKIVEDELQQYIDNSNAQTSVEGKKEDGSRAGYEPSDVLRK